MTIDVYSSTGTKKGTATLPKTLFEAPINEGLMHQFLVLQQANRRNAIAHTKERGDVQGSTRKLFAQKGTGRARRGSVRSPVLRGGNKAFGPKKNQNFSKNMPKGMRRRALLSCLSLQAKEGKILGLENYPEEIKTKTMNALLTKLPVDIGRKILFVTADGHDSLTLSLRNIPNVKSVRAAYLNPEDILGSKHIVFLVDGLKQAEEVFGKGNGKREMGKGSVATHKKDTAEETEPKAKTQKLNPSQKEEKSTPKAKTS